MTPAGYFESEPVPIAPARSAELEFDIRAKGFKCKETDWLFGASVRGLESVRRLGFVIYSGRRKATVTFDGIRAE